MSSASHAASIGAAGGAANRGRSQRVDSTRRLRSGRPITLVCERIWCDWLRGVTERSLSIMYELQRESVEEVLREQAQAMARAMRLAGVRLACLLVGLVAYDAWEAAVSADAAVVARSFRRRRGSRRRRGLEDGGTDAVDHARAECRTTRVGGGLVWQG